MNRGRTIVRAATTTRTAKHMCRNVRVLTAAELHVVSIPPNCSKRIGCRVPWRDAVIHSGSTNLDNTRRKSTSVPDCGQLTLFFSLVWESARGVRRGEHQKSHCLSPTQFPTSPGNMDGGRLEAIVGDGGWLWVCRRLFDAASPPHAPTHPPPILHPLHRQVRAPEQL